MKKNVLALSITAALVGFGFAGGAQAVALSHATDASPLLANSALASSLYASPDGIGHFLYVPYFSVQGGNVTMINLVNTDTTHGKAVKVRFRGAGNSDDLFDFQVFLSPGDVWTGNVSKLASSDPLKNGLAILNTPDASCTKPAKSKLAGDHGINDEAFHTARMNNFRTGDLLANETREGYVEIFNMADINSGSSLFTAIKHSAGVAPCTGTAWTNLDTDFDTVGLAALGGLSVPSTGLMGNWIILNATDAGAWSGPATAIVATNSLRAPSTGQMVYFPQTNATISGVGANITKFTADPWLAVNPTYAMAYDLPDFSIPYVNLQTDPNAQVTALSDVLATTKVINEFLTASAINSTTDWVLSMPTRRYNVAWDYFATTPAAVYNTGLTKPYFSPTNTTVIDKQICVKGTTNVSYDQEERTALGTTDSVIVSPVLPGTVASFVICGEASVLAFNHGETASSTGLVTSASGTLKATVARSAIENGYSAGWTAILTPGLAGIGLPILGYEAVRATGAVVNGSAATFGATLPHRTNLLLK